jgi:hypothetical protein
MKIIIENVKFDFDMGCKLLKLKYDECPTHLGEHISDVWGDIIPATFKEIAELDNLEARRVGILCLGLEKLVKEVNPILIDKKTLKKTTTWVTENGDIETKKFNDTYELYSVSGDVFSKGVQTWRKMEDVYYIKCKDTSTDREYIIWVDISSVKSTNGINGWDSKARKINAIDCIAWTIQTNVPEGKIEKIVRQGDCILIKPKGKYKNLSFPRHLTAEEYKTLLVAES